MTFFFLFFSYDFYSKLYKLFSIDIDCNNRTNYIHFKRMIYNHYIMIYELAVANEMHLLNFPASCQNTSSPYSSLHIDGVFHFISFYMCDVEQHFYHFLCRY